MSLRSSHQHFLSELVTIAPGLKTEPNQTKQKQEKPQKLVGPGRRAIHGNFRSPLLYCACISGTGKTPRDDK